MKSSHYWNKQFPFIHDNIRFDRSRLLFAEGLDTLKKGHNIRTEQEDLHKLIWPTQCVTTNDLNTAKGGRGGERGRESQKGKKERNTKTNPQRAHISKKAEIYLISIKTTMHFSHGNSQKWPLSSLELHLAWSESGLVFHSKSVVKTDESPILLGLGMRDKKQRYITIQSSLSANISILLNISTFQFDTITGIVLLP